MGKRLFVLLQYLLPQHALSRLLGTIMESQIDWFKNLLIRWFIKKYQVDLSEAEVKDLNQYNSFNEFFVRHLKKTVRPLPQASEVIVSPADGSVSQIGTINNNQLIQAKGQFYELKNLLAGLESANRFSGGSFATIYLSPKDYHRVHMPVSGKLKQMTYVPGNLFSVNPATSQHVANLFARNERVICLFETEIGSMALILVGAMLVAGIQTTWHGQVTPGQFQGIQTINYQDKPIYLNKGEEMGFFNFGSTVIVLFEPNKMRWDSSINLDSFIKVRSKLGVVL